MTPLLLAAGSSLLATGCMQDDLQEDLQTEAPLADREALEGMENFAPTRVLKREDFYAKQAVDAEDLEKIDNGDGTWSYALPAGFDAGTAVSGKLVTWRYVGQARYGNDPQPPTSTRFHVVQEEEQLSNRQKLRRMKRIDAQGRIWRAASVDMERWRELNATAPEELEDDNFAPAARRTLEPAPAPGTIISWKPMSWNHYNCSGANGNDLHLWDGESRVAKTGSLTNRQKTAVRVFNNGSICSGTIIRQDEILTAAHCVSDNSNNPVPNGNISVCRYDTGQCRNATDIDFSGSYGGGSGSGGGTDFGDDWAIIELSGSWTSTAQDMDLSSASNSTISNLDNLKNLAFPGFATVCGGANGGTLYYNKENQPVASITNKKLKMKIDGTAGHSGSPIYYCPTGDNDQCGSGDTAFVIGVFAGWNSVSNRHVGPKVPNFKTAATVFLDD